MSVDNREGDTAAVLDGNAAGGILSEVFAFDITTALVTCDGCGTAGRTAGARLYGGSMGTILRCVHCGTAVMRLARTPNGYCFDLLGARRIFVAV
jgi:hypothetical protein